jgi:hypoxanthine phosphoribosyltransferase
MKKLYVDDQQIKEYVNKIAFQMYKDNWRPDYIVGLTRGGLIPAVYMSHMLDIPMETLKVALRDGAGGESNCWMAEDAFGYLSASTVPRPEGEPTSDPALRKNILILDDINDTGATLDWIIEDWQGINLPNDPAWADIWGNNVRFAVLFDNLSSKFSRCVDYHAVTINKAEEPVWIVYPWER